MDRSPARSWEISEDLMAVEAKRQEVICGKATVEDANLWAREGFGAELFLDLFALDLTYHYFEGSCRLPVVVGWIVGKGDRDRATTRYREFQMFGLRDEAWFAAERGLRTALLRGDLTATAIEAEQAERAIVPPWKWNELQFRRHGAADVLVLKDSFRPRYTGARVGVADVLRLWPEQSLAVRKIVQKQADVDACISALAVLMKAHPHTPVPKAKLGKDFPLSKRAFDRAYSEAARQANAAAWSAAGRRRSKTPQG